MWETLRYGLRGGGGDSPGAEILATGVAADVRGPRHRCPAGARRGRGAAAGGVCTPPHVVTAVGNVAAVRAYERGGFRRVGLDEVHRGVAQELLVWP